MTENPVVSRMGQSGVRWLACTAPNWEPAIGVIGFSERDVRKQYRSRIVKWAKLGLPLRPTTHPARTATRQ
jgi:hypothetical protein